MANSALLQTVPRTVNTGMGALFILAALAVLGGDSLTDFALALLIGIVVGTYSSMFTGAPLAVELERRVRTPRRRSRAAAGPRPGAAGSPATTEPACRDLPTTTPRAAPLSQGVPPSVRDGDC